MFNKAKNTDDLTSVNKSAQAHTMPKQTTFGCFMLLPQAQIHRTRQVRLCLSFRELCSKTRAHTVWHNADSIVAAFLHPGAGLINQQRLHPMPSRTPMSLAHPFPSVAATDASASSLEQQRFVTDNT